jgi:hypothetical protein
MLLDVGFPSVQARIGVMVLFRGFAIRTAIALEPCDITVSHGLILILFCLWKPFGGSLRFGFLLLRRFGKGYPADMTVISSRRASMRVLIRELFKHISPYV